MFRDMEELLSIRGYAKHRGCYPSYIGRLVKLKKIPLTDGKIDPVQADEILARTTRPKVAKPAHPMVVPNPVPRNGAPAEVEALTYSEALARRTTAQAALAEIDLAEKRGDVVNRLEFERASAAFDDMMKRRLSGLPSKLTPLLANQPAPKVFAILDAEIFELLSEFNREDN